MKLEVGDEVDQYRIDKCDNLKSVHVPAKCKSWAGMKEWQGIPLIVNSNFTLRLRFTATAGSL